MTPTVPPSPTVPPTPPFLRTPPVPHALPIPGVQSIPHVLPIPHILPIPHGLPLPATPATPAAGCTSSRPGPVRRVVVAGALGTGLALLSTLPAAAHVRVTADSTEPGSYSALTFRVPNEDERASTTELSVQLPQDTPFASVRTRTVPGWRAELVTAPLPTPVDVNGTTVTEAVRTVTWTAERGAAIEPGQYQEFSLSVGPMPAGGELLLPATQTYSDGEVVRWDEPTLAGGAEPEHPAPALQVAATTTRGADAPVAPPVTTASASIPAATWLGGGALALATIATGLAALALRTARTRGRA